MSGNNDRQLSGQSEGEGTVIASGCLPRVATVRALPPATLSEARSLGSGSNFLTPSTAKGKEAAERNRGVRENRVQVAVRVRPFTKADGNVKEIAIKVYGNSIKIAKQGELTRDFAYDYVFTEGQDVWVFPVLYFAS
jgi:hypothetical protein